MAALSSVPARTARAPRAVAPGWALRLPYPLRNALNRWQSLLSMIVGVGIALSIGMTILAVISAEMDLLTGDYERSGIGVYVATQGGKIIARLAGDTPGTIQNASTVLAQVRSWPGVHSAIGALTWTMAREDEGPRRRGQLTELISVIGVDGDPQTVPNMLELNSGRWLRGGNEIVLGRTLAKDKALHVGDSLRITRVRAASFSALTSRPSNRTAPLLGVSSRPASCRNVLLPDPDGPKRSATEYCEGKAYARRAPDRKSGGLS